MTPFTIEHFKQWQIEWYTELLERAKKSRTLAMMIFYNEILTGLKKAQL